MHGPDELTEIFRRRGLKVTPQRQAVFRAIHDDVHHPDAETVHERVARDLPTISLRTVYQTLNDLAAMGEIRNLDVGTGSTRFDPNVDGAHDHVVCDVCAMVRDLPDDSAAVTPLGLPEGFEVSGAELIVRGRCARCAASHRGALHAPSSA